MKMLLALMFIVVGATSLIGCAKDYKPEEIAANQAQDAQDLEEYYKQNARSIQGTIRYTKDRRTNLCFAFHRDIHQYGTAVSNVPCDAIPADLLIE